MSLSSLVECLSVRPGAYPRVVRPNRVGSNLNRKHQTRLVRIARDKNFSLFLTVVNYRGKKFVTRGPGHNA